MHAMGARHPRCKSWTAYQMVERDAREGAILGLGATLYPVVLPVRRKEVRVAAGS